MIPDEHERNVVEDLRDLADRIESGELTVSEVRVEPPERDQFSRAVIEYMNRDDWDAMTASLGKPSQ